MIAINQVKSEIPWNGHRLQIRDMIDSEEVLRKKAAAVLHIDAVQIRKVEIIKHGRCIHWVLHCCMKTWKPKL